MVDGHLLLLITKDLVASFRKSAEKGGQQDRFLNFLVLACNPPIARTRSLLRSQLLLGDQALNELRSILLVGLNPFV
jgi:hypothetical protein